MPAATKTTIVGIASTYRSSKVLVQFTTDDGRFGYNELNVIHDGTTVDVLEYGDLVTGAQGTATGLGTYGADMSAGTINVDFTPAVGLALTANTVRVSLSSTESVGVGTTIIGQSTENIASLESFHTSIGSTSSPGIHTIATYTCGGENDYQAHIILLVLKIRLMININFLKSLY